MYAVCGDKLIGRVKWYREIRQIASAAIAALTLGTSAVFSASADVSGATPIAKVPTFLGIDLPLRPGERLVPIGDGTCSAVIFAPHNELADRLSKYWSDNEWFGGCRFGLAHGRGYAVNPRSNSVSDKVMMYGVEIVDPISAKQESMDGGALSWTGTRYTMVSYSGPAFSDLRAVRYIYYFMNSDGADLTLVDLVSAWFSSNYLERHSFAQDGREWTMSISALDVAPYCGKDLAAEFKPFSKEIKKACGIKKSSKLILHRREGYWNDAWAHRKVTWAKACMPKDGFTECGGLLREGLGKEASEFETTQAQRQELRQALVKEIAERYASLEAAVDARASNSVKAEGVQ